MEKTHKLILMGDSLFAEIAYEYFTYESNYEVVAFSVEEAYLQRTSLFGLPVVPFETLEDNYAPADHSFYAALVYTQLNRLRARLYHDSKQKGYTPASFISPRAFIWRNVQIGEHCFIFEDNTVQPFVTIGNNVVLWSGNHIGHHSIIRNHNFISSHVVISGVCDIGESCFFGVNATVGNNVTIGADCLIGASAVVVKDTPENTLVKATVSEHASVSARRYFKVES
ncbi:MAG: acetyltransferase [Chloroflexota bacterium]|nr:acetyltransferase [Chloroflexota bacterium]